MNICKIMKNNKIYHVAYPYFSDKDISWVIEQVPNILNGRLSTGPYTEEFEKKFANFIGTKYAVFLNSCTSALEISASFLKLAKSDEVIVPAETFIASGMAVTNNNGKVVFAEIEEDTFCLGFDEIKKLTTQNTKAIILVHFGGYISKDTIKIRDYCKKNNIFLIEDCAHSIGSSINKIKAGNIGNVGCFSFFSTKTITTGEGGMLTTNDRELYDYALSMRERGRDWSHPTEIYKYQGRTYRVPEFSAVLGLSQFSNINNIVDHRKKICKIYDNRLKKSNLFKTLPNYNNIDKSIWKHITLITNDNLKRDKLSKILKENYNIFINWAYDPPIHLQPVYKNLMNTKEGMLPKTERLMTQHFHLPLHMLISEDDASYIINSLIEASNKILYLK